MGIETVAALVIARGASQFVQAAQTGRFHRKLAERNALEATPRAGAEEERFRRGATRTIAAERARLAAAGGGLSGTLPLLADLAADAEENALLIRFGGQAEAARQRFTGRFRQRESILGGFGAFTQGVALGTSLLIK